MPDQFTGGAARTTDRDLQSFAALLAVPLRHVRLLLASMAVTMVLAVALGALLAQYASESQFTPSTTSSSLQGLAGVAAQFGFNVGSLSAGPSVDSYGSLIQSRSLLTDAVETTYRFATTPGGRDTLAGTLLTLYRVGGKTRADSVLRAIDVLRHRLNVTVDDNGNTVTIDIKAPWLGLAEGINRRLLDGLNSFNVEQMKSQAKLQRQFIEARMTAAQMELDSSEAHLREFLEANRTYQTSPRLQFEEQRLQARLDLRQQVYTTLAQSYEQARIAEVRDTPVITIIDAPEGSGQRHRHIARNGILGVLLGGILGMALALAQEYLQRERERFPEDYVELTTLQTTFMGRLRLKRSRGAALT